MAESSRERIGFLSLRPVARLAAADWGLAVGAYLAALVVRALLVHVHAYTAEATHYVLARDLWATDPPVTALDGSRAGWAWLFWQRPLFSLLLWPGAAVSFTGYRILNVLVASLAPALGVLLLRQLGTPRWLAGGAAAVLALHPTLVPWNVLVLPDSLMTTLFLGALLAAERSRPLASAVLALMAVWTKEVAAAGVLALFLLAAWREPGGARSRLYPLSLGRWATLYAAVLLLTFVPLAYSLQLPWARFPGWDLGGDGRVVLERLFVVLWLAPLPLVGLLDAATRRLAAVTLAWTGFFVVYHFALGKAVEAWYYVAPVTMMVLLLAAVLAALWRRTTAPVSKPKEATRRPAATRRLVPLGVTVAVTALLALQILAPDTVAAKQALVGPITRQGQWSLGQAMAYEETREQGLYDAMAAAHGDPHGTWVAIDIDWSFWPYPMADHTGRVVAYYTAGVTPLDRDADALAHAIAVANATLLYKLDNPLNAALRAAYHDCTVLESGNYILVEGGRCPDAAAKLHAANVNQ